MTRCRFRGPSRSTQRRTRSLGSIRIDRRGISSPRAWATLNAYRTATPSSASRPSDVSSKSPRTARSFGSTSIRFSVGRSLPDRQIHRATWSSGPSGTAPKRSHGPRLRPAVESLVHEPHAMNTRLEERTTMLQQIAPIAVRPSLLNGLSEQMVVSHYEDNYGNAVRALNAVRRELAALDADTPPYRLRGLKREELSLMGSVVLHELYFGNLGGYRRAGPNSGLGRPDWHEVPDAFTAGIAADFGSADAWRREFVGTAQSLAGGSGWVLLTYSRRLKRFGNQIATDHAQAAVDAAPVLVLDMYEHAYQVDFGANATAYIDTFLRNLNWDAVLKR